MSAFSFINESRLNNNQTSNKAASEDGRKREQETTAYRPSRQASNSLFTYRATQDDPFNDHNSRNSPALSSNEDNDAWNKNFKSSFSFMNQDNSPKSSSHVAKHQPLKFSSSFIMEDFMDSDEDRASSRSDKSIKKENVNKYFSLIDDDHSTFTDKKRNGSRKGMGKLAQSMMVSSDRTNGRAPLNKSAFHFINQGNRNQY